MLTSFNLSVVCPLKPALKFINMLIISPALPVDTVLIIDPFSIIWPELALYANSYIEPLYPRPFEL